jgi:hypothetical protein
MENQKKEVEVLVQGFKFNLKGTKAMTRVGFVKSWKEQKLVHDPQSKGKGRYGRFDPEKAWDELFPPKAK